MKKILVSTVVLAFILTSTSCKKDEETTTATSNLKAFTTTVNLAYNSSQTDPMCFIDFDAGKAYKVSEALAHQSEIDMVYVLRYMPANDPMFLSLGDFDGKPGMTGAYWDKTTLGINQFSTFNHTLIKGAGSSNTASGFATLKTVTEFNTWLNGNDPIHDFSGVEPTDIGNIYLFRTHQNKRGAFKVTDCKNGSQGYANLEIKIEP
jgi:hypothetical protein